MNEKPITHVKIVTGSLSEIEYNVNKMIDCQLDNGYDCVKTHASFDFEDDSAAVMLSFTLNEK